MVAAVFVLETQRDDAPAANLPLRTERRHNSPLEKRVSVIVWISVGPTFDPHQTRSVVPESRASSSWLYKWPLENGEAAHAVAVRPRPSRTRTRRSRRDSIMEQITECGILSVIPCARPGFE